MPIVSTGQFTITDLNDGIRSELSKPAHVLPASAGGVVSTYTGSGTQIRVYQGGTELTYDGIGTANGTWRIASTTPTNITVGTITDSGTFATIGDHSVVADATDTSTIQYNISGRSLSGEAFTLSPTQTFSKARAGAPGANAVVIDLSNDNASVPANFDGSSPNFTGVSTTLSIFEGGVDTTASWTIAQALSSGLTGTASGTPANRTFAPSGLTVDSGTVTFTATRSGYATQTIVFTITKAKAGTPGTNSTVYDIRTSQATVKRLQSGSYSNSSLVVSLFSTTGTGAPTAYAGRFIIATSTDGTTYTDRYTSAANESSYTYSILASVNFIRVSAYLAGGTTTLIDQEIIPVADDGVAGQNNATITLYQRAASAPTAPAGNYTYTFSTRAITESTGSWTAAIPAGSNPLYVTTANASSNAATATITFSAAVLFVQNGSQGDPGIRGSKDFYASGTSWSDATADSIITTQGLTKVLLDQVTISGTNFSQTRYWNGTSWVQVTQVVDGNLLVNGTVGANALVAGTVLANVFNVGDTKFKLDGAAKGVGKGSLIVSNGTNDILTVGYLDASNIGMSLKDASGNIVMQTSTPAGGGSTTNSFTPAISNTSVSSDPSVTRDSLLLDPSVWNTTMPASRFFVDTDGTGYVQIPSGVANDLIPKFAHATPIDPNATYEAEWEIMEEGSGTPTSRYYTVVYCWDAAGNVIGVDGTYWYYPASFALNVGRGSYERRLARFGRGTLRPFPANAAKFAIGILLNYNSSAVVTRARRIRTTRIDAENFSVNGDASRWQLANDSAIRWSGVGGWNQTTVRSKVALSGAQSLSFDLVAPSAMCGLTDAANAAGYADLDYAWYCETGATGVIQIYESGINVWNTSGYTNVEDVRLRIEYDGNRVKYYINGSLARTVIAGAGRSFRTAVDCNNTGAGFRNIRHIAAETNAYIGENTFDKVGNPVAIENIRNNLALIDWWKKGATIPWGTNLESNSIISVPSSPNFTTIQPPILGQPDVWLCEEVSDNGNNGGGWHAVPLSPMNPDKAYRFVLPIRIMANGGNATGVGAGTSGAYWGTNNVADINTTTLNGNPYFAVVSRSALQSDRWYLFVGYIFPRNSTDKNNSGAGVWDCKTGQKISGGINYAFLPDGTQPTHRAYQYYSSQGSQQMFGMPLIEPIERMSDLTLYFEDPARLNNSITIDANGNFINPVATGSGTSVSNTLVANRFVSRGSVAAIIEGNTIRRSSGTGDYDSFVSGDPITGACFAEAIIAGGGWTMVALDSVATTGGYLSQDFVVHASVTGGINIYTNGTSLASGLPAPSAGQVLRITYDGARYQAFVNGVQIGTDYIAPSGQTLFPIFNAYNGPGSYTGLNYGTYSINSAQTKFIVNTTSGSTLRLIGSNTILRDAGGTDWNSQCYSSQGYEGGAFCSFTPTASNCYFMAGLNSDPTTNSSYLSLDYAFYMPNASDIRIYESGNGITAPDGTTTFGTWAADTVLSIIYDNQYIRYLINGDEVRCIRTDPRRKFFFDSSIVAGPAVSNIQFGPVTPDSSNVDFIHDSDRQSQRGNSIYKNSKAVGTWNSKSVSTQIQTGTAFVSGKLPGINTFIGLKRPADAGSTSSYDSMQASFHRSGNGNWYTWTYSGSRINMGTSYLGVTFDSNTEFRITYDGVKLRWYANTTLVDELATSSGETYAACVVIYDSGNRVDNIQFGPYTDNAWVSVAGTGRPEDNATVGATAGTNLRRSNATVLSDNDIITSAGTAAAIANQTAWATYSTHTPADVAPKTVDWLGPRTYQDVSVAANGSSRWLRVARVDAAGGRGTATISISGGGGGVTPGKLTLEVSVDWSGLATLTILSASRYFPAQSIRLSRTGTQTYLDLLATPIGTGTSLRIEVIPNVGSGGIWQVNYVDNPTIGSTNLGLISIEGASGGTRLTGTVILDGGTVTSTLSDAGGGIRTNGTQAIDSNGNAFDVLAGTTKAVAERGANITETRTASAISNQAATATSSDFSAVTGTTKPENNATVGATAGTNLRRSNANVLNDNDIITSAGTAAAILNQGGLATKSSVAWASEVSGRDTFLTDNRIPTGLDSSGRSQVGIVAGGGNVHTNAEIVGTVNGTNIAVNPEFIDGTGNGISVYNNAGGSKVTIGVETDQSAPNASGYRLWINYDGSGTPDSNPTPGYGGIVQFLQDSVGGGFGGRAVPGRYARNSTIIFSIIASIPTGRNIAHASNSIGNEASFEWLTDTAGTSTWKRYVLRAKIGSTGTFSSTGFLYIYGGPNSAFTWYIAKYDQIDITSSPRQVLGRAGVMRENGLPLFDGDIITASGTAAAIANQTDWATYTGRTTADVSNRLNFLQTDGTMRLGSGNGLINSDGSLWLTDSNTITAQGTSAAIANQGALATRSTARIGTDIVDDDGTTVLTAPKLRNNRTDGSMAIVSTPEGGSFTSDSPNISGAIRVGLPAARRGSNTMMAFRVTIYDYDANTSVIYEVGGYNYETGWINTFARALGPTNAAKPVRFGRDDTRDYIWIGNTDTVWQYPKVSITDLRTGYSNFAHGLWETGWQVVLTTSAFSNVVATYLEPNAGDTVFGINTKETWNGTVATLPNFKTSQGTASGILNQAATATSSDFASVTGTTKPANNATVGAVIGTNLTGTFTETEVGNRFNSNSIGSTYIKDISASKITTGTISASASVTVGSSGGNAALLLDGSKRQIVVRDASNNIRVKIGDLSV